MNIALIGYGKMGKMVESAAVDRGHRVVVVVDPFITPSTRTQSESIPRYATDIGSVDLAKECVDVAIEFTRPETAFTNVTTLVTQQIPVVVGTTGWYEKLPDLKDLVLQKGGSVLWSSNFSLGVNLLYRIVSYAATLMNDYDEYDVGGFEIHHNKKADSPSGTAKTIVNTVLAAMTRKKVAQWETLNRPPRPEELHYTSLRLGSVPGTHTLYFDSGADTIEITHTARSREGFAQGAIRAAEWLVGCSGPGMARTMVRQGVFTMDDVLA